MFKAVGKVSIIGLLHRLYGRNVKRPVRFSLVLVPVADVVVRPPAAVATSVGVVLVMDAAHVRVELVLPGEALGAHAALVRLVLV